MLRYFADARASGLGVKLIHRCYVDASADASVSGLGVMLTAQFYFRAWNEIFAFLITNFHYNSNPVVQIFCSQPNLNSIHLKQPTDKNWRFCPPRNRNFLKPPHYVLIESW